MSDLISRKTLIKEVENSKKENPHSGRIEKQMHNHDFEIPKYLKINPEDILLLEE